MDLKKRLSMLKVQAEQNLQKLSSPPSAGMKWAMDKEKKNWIQVPIDSPTEMSSETVEVQAAIDEIIFSLADGEEFSNEEFGKHFAGFMEDGLIEEVKEPQSLNSKVAAKFNKNLKFYAATDKLYDVVMKKISGFEEQLAPKKTDINLGKAIRYAALKANVISKKIVVNARTGANLGILVREGKNGLEVKNSKGKISNYWPQEVI